MPHLEGGTTEVEAALILEKKSDDERAHDSREGCREKISLRHRREGRHAQHSRKPQIRRLHAANNQNINSMKRMF